jgi:L-histidine Nalpha-methyltransferase
LGANFNLSHFRHDVFWNADQRRIEMHLRSLSRQSVEIPAAALTITLDEGETIWTESSHKYYPEEVGSMAEKTGFCCDAQWIDREWPFAQNLLLAQ